MDTVFIEGLTVETVIGVYDWERNVRQTLSVDLEMGFDVANAMASDNLKDTLNYAEVANDIQQLAGNHQCLLLEAFVGILLDQLIQKYRLPWVRIKVKKLGAVANAASVGLVVERGLR